MADQFGVEFDAVEWITLEEGHVAGVADPPAVRRAPSGSDLMTMLRDGSIDAAIVDPVPADPRFLAVVPDPGGDVPRVAAAARRSHPQPRHRRPRVARETRRRHVRAVQALPRQPGAGADAAVDRASTPLGLAANRRNLEVAIAAADAQGLLARPLTVDDLVTDVVASLQ